MSDTFDHEADAMDDYLTTIKDLSKSDKENESLKTKLTTEQALSDKLFEKLMNQCFYSRHLTSIASHVSKDKSLQGMCKELDDHTVKGEEAITAYRKSREGKG